MVGRYWRDIFARAFRDSLRAVRYESGTRLMLAVLFSLAVILSLYLLGSADAWKDEAVAKAAPFALALIGFPVIFLWNLLSAPARIHLEQDEKIKALNAELVPTLRLSIAEGSGFSRAAYGGTTTSLGGTKQTTITGRGMLDGLLVDCKNISASAIEKCEAFLVDVRLQGLSGSLEPIKIDAIPLAWLPTHNEKNYQTSIPSQGHRRVVALIKLGNYVYFPTDNIPARLIHVFEEAGVFFLTVMICPYGAASVPLTVKLVTGSTPTIEAVTEG